MSEPGLVAILKAFQELEIFGDDDVGLVMEEIEAQRAASGDDEIRAMEAVLPERMRVIQQIDEEHNLTTKYPLMMAKIAAAESEKHHLLAQKKKAQADLIAYRRGAPV